MYNVIIIKIQTFFGRSPKKPSRNDRRVQCSPRPVRCRYLRPDLGLRGMQIAARQFHFTLILLKVRRRSKICHDVIVSVLKLG